MHGHSDSSWSGSSLPEITEQRIFHVLFYYEQIRLTGIIQGPRNVFEVGALNQ